MQKNTQKLHEPTLYEIFKVFLMLGLTSFGGPIAHLGFFNKELVVNRKWIDSHLFSELIALCQFLPGPSSSQVGLSIGFIKKGFSGAFAAWLGFTSPSAIIIILFGYGYVVYEQYIPFGVIHGLKIFAVSVVAHAIWTMGNSFCKDYKSIIIAILSAIIIIIWPTPLNQFLVILITGIISMFVLSASKNNYKKLSEFLISTKYALLILVSFFVILFSLPVLSAVFNDPVLNLIDSFFRAGSLVFGGGHVVLPLLQADIVSSGLVSNEKFLAGYGVAQAMPGPLFTFGAYLGAVSSIHPNGLLGGLTALIAIFLPSFLLIFGVLPFWSKIRDIIIIKRAIIGINACVVGVLIAAFYSPVFTSGILSLHDFILALILFLILKFTKFPIWGAVIFGSLECGLYYSFF